MTPELFEKLKSNWGATIQAIYPDIEEIPRGTPDSIESLLSTWRDKVYAKPTPEQIEAALIEVLATQAAEDAARQTKRDAFQEALQRLTDSPLADKTPAEIYTLMQGRVDGWGSLAAAKADMREWFPLMTAAIFHLIRRS